MPIPTRPVGHTVSERGPQRVPAPAYDPIDTEIRFSITPATEAWLEGRRLSGETLGLAARRVLDQQAAKASIAERIAAKRAEIGDFLDSTIVLHMPPRAPWWSRALHNCLAHPLLILCPPLGEWLHERTEP